MGGELKLKSELGKGSEFYFSAVFSLADPNVEEEMKTEQEKKKAGGAEGISLEHRNILLAEDNDLNAEIAIELLKMKGARRVQGGEWKTGCGTVYGEQSRNVSCHSYGSPDA